MISKYENLISKNQYLILKKTGMRHYHSSIHNNNMIQHRKYSPGQSKIPLPELTQVMISTKSIVEAVNYNYKILNLS